MADDHILHLPAGDGEPDFGTGSVFFVGTATVIIRYGGFTILTDPNFLHAGDHVHLGYGLTSERLTNPAIELDALPPIDLVVLSHLHGDHFDHVVEERLDHSLPIVTTEHGATELRAKGFSEARSLETWEALTVVKGQTTLRVTSLPGKHAPALVQLVLPPVMGSMLEFQPGNGTTSYRLYISGDTLLYEDLEEIPRRYPDVDLGLFHLGGTVILGLMLTMDAEQGVKAVQLIAPRRAIPIHYNDYTVFQSPLDDFKEAVRAAGLEDRVTYLAHGDTYDFTVAPDRWR